ncbi:aspartic peptidase domain-containing protein [Vararia minispora EC-137]|uniref:Aspartic peptidase domain-containing protein n=1 Tax=Vararia minispora EC-137 TaxID=1314806 RepID=A0ACB8QXY8_9AGAM|nr:aspartic peptidase domain-containing protein [Vararia minispora EC-137]
MRPFLPISFLLCALGASALQLSVHRHKPASSHSSRQTRSLSPRAASDTLDLSSLWPDKVGRDRAHPLSFSLTSLDYLIQLDTGSSDLWIQGATHPIPNVNSTSLTQNLTYGSGWAYGNIAWAPASFAGINVSQQAFLDTSSAQNAVLHYGTSGVMGLGFNLLSTIDAAVNKSGGSNGRSLLYNLFYDNPSTPNYIAFSLQRSLDSLADDVQGTFSIGELDSNYTAVAGTNPIPTFPQSNPNRWNVLLDALLIGSETVLVSSVVSGAPSDKAVVLLDSGSSYTYAPTQIVNAIYGNISGASFDSGAQQWQVPCTAEIDLAFQINGHIYPLHPLDVVIKSTSAVNVCAGSFIPQDTSSFSGVVDWIAGDNFLRSVYSVYDFGDFDSSGKMGNPYVKLLQLVDPNKASAEFASERNTTARSNITYNAASGSSGSTVVSLSNSLSTTLDRINNYLPAVLALMAFNALAVLILLIGASVWLCRRRRARADGGLARARKTKGRATPSPLPLEPMATEAGVRDSTATYLEPGYMSSSSKGAYQPVSMALTEDTFVPPSPAFSRYGDGGLPKGIDRPRSVA